MSDKLVSLFENIKVPAKIVQEVRSKKKELGVNIGKFFEQAASEKLHIGWRFKSGSLIKTPEGKFQCICADASCAVFAPGIGGRTHFKEMFAVANSFDDGFEYELIK